MRKIDLTGYEAYLYNSKQKKDTIIHGNKSNATPICVLIVMIILLTGVAFYFIETREQTNEFYFVQIDEYLNYSTASKLSTEIQSKNGAGYIHFDGRYHVLASYYPTNEEAENVVEQVKEEYPSCSVYILECKKFKNKANLSKEENSAIVETLNKNLQAINRTYADTISFDKSEINEKKLSLNLQDLLSDYDKNHQDFKKIMQNSSNFDIFNGYLTKISTAMSDSIDYAKEANSASLKYELIKMVVNHSAFLDCF